MKYLILSMILSGSALMVYNILRYALFMRKDNELEKRSRSSFVTVVPLLLLVFFLIGYIVVGFSGIADLMMASILLGGSIFVFLLLWVMFSIIDHIRDTEQLLAARYEEIRQQMDEMTKNSSAMFRVNLTKDEIEERKGDCLYDSDYEYDAYSEMLEARQKNIIDPDYIGTDRSLFKRDALIRSYQEGISHVFETVLVRRRDGVASFVKFEATLTKKPVSGDIVAFIVESPYNEEVVRTTLLEKVLLDEFDRVAYIIDGKYKVFLSNTGKKSGLLLNDDKEDTYESIYFNSILPAMSYDKDKNVGKPNPLRLSVIEKELENKDVYTVDAPFTIVGAIRHKRFMFYNIDAKAKFYLMLISDSTGAIEEQEKQTRELEKALEEAVRSNDSRKRFFKNVSHNLRTPMNGILGFSELVSREEISDKAREYISKVEVSGRKLMSRLNELFDMSMIDSGTIKLEIRPADLKAELEQMISGLKDERPEKNLTLISDFSKLGDAPVLCDGARLTRVIERLMMNSIAFSPEGEKISLTASDEKDGTYLFSVKNKGVHIPEEVTGHMFESEAWDTEALGVGDLSDAGTGMIVSKALIDLMGGSVNVSSNGDEIATEVRIPLEKVKSEEKEEKAPEAQTLGSLRLLVADDNEINREIAELILTGEGHEVTLAVDGKDAVGKLCEKEFDAVLMDVQMPVMNGYEATKAIRALPDPAKASVPVIAMTANAYQEDREEAKKNGMDGYVTKPIDPERIREALSAVLNK